MTRHFNALIGATLASATLHLGVSWGVSFAPGEFVRPVLMQATGHPPQLTHSMRVRQLSAHHGQGIATVSANSAASSPAAQTPAQPQHDIQPTEALERQAHPEAPTYWPRQLLDLGPSPTSPIILPAPEDLSVPPSGLAVLELFIDANGHVDRIDVLEANAPSEFVDAAKANFRIIHFTPGLKDNVAVPSRIKIEVRYE